MAPTLYGIIVSPPVRAVLMCSKALNIELDFKVVDLLTGENRTPEYLKINPQHTVPTLVDEDGFSVWDSHAIMAYLVGKYGKDKSLYPADLKKKAIIDQRLHFDSNVLFGKPIIISRSILKEGRSGPTDEEKQAVDEVYYFVEKFLEGRKWIAGDELSIADFSFVTTITTLNIIFPYDESKFPKVSAYLKQVQALPYYEEINVPGLKKFKEFYDSKTKNKK